MWQAQPFKACRNNTEIMNVKFNYNDAPVNKGIPKIIQSVSSEIPGGVMIRGAKLPFPFALEGTPVVVDKDGNYFPLSTDVQLNKVRIVGVLGETFGIFNEYNKEDRLCRVITAGVINSEAWKQLVSQPKYKDALTKEVEDFLAPAITFNPPVNLPTNIS